MLMNPTLLTALAKSALNTILPKLTYMLAGGRMIVLQACVDGVLRPLAALGLLSKIQELALVQQEFSHGGVSKRDIHMQDHLHHKISLPLTMYVAVVYGGVMGLSITSFFGFFLASIGCAVALASITYYHFVYLIRRPHLASKSSLGQFESSKESDEQKYQEGSIRWLLSLVAGFFRFPISPDSLFGKDSYLVEKARLIYYSGDTPKTKFNQHLFRWVQKYAQDLYSCRKTIVANIRGGVEQALNGLNQLAVAFRKQRDSDFQKRMDSASSTATESSSEDSPEAFTSEYKGQDKLHNQELHLKYSYFAEVSALCKTYCGLIEDFSIKLFKSAAMALLRMLFWGPHLLLGLMEGVSRLLNGLHFHRVSQYCITNSAQVVMFGLLAHLFSATILGKTIGLLTVAQTQLLCAFGVVSMMSWSGLLSGDARFMFSELSHFLSILVPCAAQSWCLFAQSAISAISFLLLPFKNWWIQVSYSTITSVPAKDWILMRWMTSLIRWATNGGSLRAKYKEDLHAELLNICVSHKSHTEKDEYNATGDQKREYQAGFFAEANADDSEDKLISKPLSLVAGATRNTSVSWNPKTQRVDLHVGCSEQWLKESRLASSGTQGSNQQWVKESRLASSGAQGSDLNMTEQKIAKIQTEAFLSKRLPVLEWLLDHEALKLSGSYSRIKLSMNKDKQALALAEYMLCQEFNGDKSVVALLQEFRRFRNQKTALGSDSSGALEQSQRNLYEKLSQWQRKNKLLTFTSVINPVAKKIKQDDGAKYAISSQEVAYLQKEISSIYPNDYGIVKSILSLDTPAWYWSAYARQKQLAGDASRAETAGAISHSGLTAFTREILYNRIKVEALSLADTRALAIDRNGEIAQDSHGNAIIYDKESKTVADTARIKHGIQRRMNYDIDDLIKDGYKCSELKTVETTYLEENTENNKAYNDQVRLFTKLIATWVQDEYDSNASWGWFGTSVLQGFVSRSSDRSSLNYRNNDNFQEGIKEEPSVLRQIRANFVRANMGRARLEELSSEVDKDIIADEKYRDLIEDEATRFTPLIDKDAALVTAAELMQRVASLEKVRQSGASVEEIALESGPVSIDTLAPMPRAFFMGAKLALAGAECTAEKSQDRDIELRQLDSSILLEISHEANRRYLLKLDEPSTNAISDRLLELMRDGGDQNNSNDVDRSSPASESDDEDNSVSEKSMQILAILCTAYATLTVAEASSTTGKRTHERKEIIRTKLQHMIKQLNLCAEEYSMLAAEQQDPDFQPGLIAELLSSDTTVESILRLSKELENQGALPHHNNSETIAAELLQAVASVRNASTTGNPSINPAEDEQKIRRELATMQYLAAGYGSIEALSIRTDYLNGFIEKHVESKLPGIADMHQMLASCYLSNSANEAIQKEQAKNWLENNRPAYCENEHTQELLVELLTGYVAVKGHGKIKPEAAKQLFVNGKKLLEAQHCPEVKCHLIWGSMHQEYAAYLSSLINLCLGYILDFAMDIRKLQRNMFEYIRLMTLWARGYLRRKMAAARVNTALDLGRNFSTVETSFVDEQEAAAQLQRAERNLTTVIEQDAVKTQEQIEAAAQQYNNAAAELTTKTKAAVAAKESFFTFWEKFMGYLELGEITAEMCGGEGYTATNYAANIQPSDAVTMQEVLPKYLVGSSSTLLEEKDTITTQIRLTKRELEALKERINAHEQNENNPYSRETISVLSKKKILLEELLLEKQHRLNKIEEQLIKVDNIRVQAGFALKLDDAEFTTKARLVYIAQSLFTEIADGVLHNTVASEQLPDLQAQQLQDIFNEVSKSMYGCLALMDSSADSDRLAQSEFSRIKQKLLDLDWVIDLQKDWKNKNTHVELNLNKVLDNAYNGFKLRLKNMQTGEKGVVITNAQDENYWQALCSKLMDKEYHKYLVEALESIDNQDSEGSLSCARFITEIREHTEADERLETRTTFKLHSETKKSWSAGYKKIDQDLLDNLAWNASGGSMLAYIDEKFKDIAHGAGDARQSDFIITNPAVLELEQKVRYLVANNSRELTSLLQEKTATYAAEEITKIIAMQDAIQMGSSTKLVQFSRMPATASTEQEANSKTLQSDFINNLLENHHQGDTTAVEGKDIEKTVEDYLAALKAAVAKVNNEKLLQLWMSNCCKTNDLLDVDKYLLADLLAANFVCTHGEEASEKSLAAYISTPIDIASAVANVVKKYPDYHLHPLSGPKNIQKQRDCILNHIAQMNNLEEEDRFRTLATSICNLTPIAIVMKRLGIKRRTLTKDPVQVLNEKYRFTTRQPGKMVQFRRENRGKDPDFLHRTKLIKAPIPEYRNDLGASRKRRTWSEYFATWVGSKKAQVGLLQGFTHLLSIPNGTKLVKSAYKYEQDKQNSAQYQSWFDEQNKTVEERAESMYNHTRKKFSEAVGKQTHDIRKQLGDKWDKMNLSIELCLEYINNHLEKDSNKYNDCQIELAEILAECSMKLQECAAGIDSYITEIIDRLDRLSSSIINENRTRADAIAIAKNKEMLDLHRLINAMQGAKPPKAQQLLSLYQAFAKSGFENTKAQISMSESELEGSISPMAFLLKPWHYAYVQIWLYLHALPVNNVHAAKVVEDWINGPNKRHPDTLQSMLTGGLLHFNSAVPPALLNSEESLGVTLGTNWFSDPDDMVLSQSVCSADPNGGAAPLFKDFTKILKGKAGVDLGKHDRLVAQRKKLLENEQLRKLDQLIKEHPVNKLQRLKNLLKCLLHSQGSAAVLKRIQGSYPLSNDVIRELTSAIDKLADAYKGTVQNANISERYNAIEVILSKVVDEEGHSYEALTAERKQIMSSVDSEVSHSDIAAALKSDEAMAYGIITKQQQHLSNEEYVDILDYIALAELWVEQKDNDIDAVRRGLITVEKRQLLEFREELDTRQLLEKKQQIALRWLRDPFGDSGAKGDVEQWVHHRQHMGVRVWGLGSANIDDNHTKTREKAWYMNQLILPMVLTCLLDGGLIYRCSDDSTLIDTNSVVDVIQHQYSHPITTAQKVTLLQCAQKYLQLGYKITSTVFHGALCIPIHALALTARIIHIWRWEINIDSSFIFALGVASGSYYRNCIAAMGGIIPAAREAGRISVALLCRRKSLPALPSRLDIQKKFAQSMAVLKFFAKVIHTLGMVVMRIGMEPFLVSIKLQKMLCKIIYGGLKLSVKLICSSVGALCAPLHALNTPLTAIKAIRLNSRKLPAKEQTSIKRKPRSPMSSQMGLFARVAASGISSVFARLTAAAGA